MNYRIVFSLEAQEQLAALYSYIATAGSPDVAARYAEAIVSYCESLCTFPHRGNKRDDVRPGTLRLNALHSVLRGHGFKHDGTCTAPCTRRWAKAR